MEEAIKSTIKMEKVYNLALRQAVCYKGKWYCIKGKKYEPERQTSNIAWDMIKNNREPVDAYRLWYKRESEDAKLLYPDFRKE